jgi:small subunit ribosomal protein S17
MAKALTGQVMSAKTDKTIVVRVQTRKTHPIYKKQFTTSKRFLVHDEKNQAKLGDTVSFIETRPISARKHHKLDKVLTTAAIVHKDEEEIVS